MLFSRASRLGKRKEGISSSGVSFNPLMIEGCTLWLDAADDSQIEPGTPATGISAWYDKSVNGDWFNRFTGKTVYSPAGDQHPANGTVLFGVEGLSELIGHVDLFDSGLYAPEGSTFFVAHKALAGDGGLGPIITTQSGYIGMYVNNDPGNVFAQSDGDSLFLVETTLNDGAWDYYSGRHSQVDETINTAIGSAGFNENSVSSENQTANGGGVVLLGAGSAAFGGAGFIQGSVGEIIVYSRSLEDVERRIIGDYLQRKWSTAH